jgi:hypothetical protein
MPIPRVVEVPVLIAVAGPSLVIIWNLLADTPPATRISAPPPSPRRVGPEHGGVVAYAPSRALPRRRARDAG